METNNSLPSSTPSDADAARARFLESMGIPITSDLEKSAPAPISADSSQANPPAKEAALGLTEDSGLLLSSSPDTVELPGANSHGASPARVTSVQTGTPTAATSPTLAPEAKTASRIELSAAVKPSAPAPVAEAPATEAPVTLASIETAPPPLEPEAPLSELRAPVSEEAPFFKEIPPPLEPAAPAPTPEAPAAEAAPAEIPLGFDTVDNSPAPAAEAEEDGEAATASMFSNEKKPRRWKAQRFRICHSNCPK